jgi:hypothetical protein
MGRNPLTEVCLTKRETVSDVGDHLTSSVTNATTLNSSPPPTHTPRKDIRLTWAEPL